MFAMLEIRIKDEEVARKLRDRAAKENRAVDEIVSEILSDSMEQLVDDPDYFGSGAHLADIARRANIRTGAPFDSAHTDEIVNDVYEERI
jgi:plasmid stability protein